MYLRLPFLIFLLATSATSSEASLFPRTFTTTAQRAHHLAIRHSAGLARDLRIALGGVLLSQPSDPGPGHKVFCVSSKGPNGVPQGNSTISSAGNVTSARGGSGTSTSAGAAPTALATDWNLVQNYQGNNFFSDWDFFVGADPTHGIVQYLDQADAQSAGLYSVNSKGNAVMSVETTPQVQSTRKSVRITTQAVFTGGLLIMDAVHMPTGCGTWPAFWSDGPNWPAGGEIDIVEGVNDYTNNQATVHTNPGCSLTTTSSAALSITGNVVGPQDCAAADTNNQGCGVRAAQNNSFGAAFNNIGGGVYAMQWDNSGIAVYFFARNSIPSDITAGAPQPTNWGNPIARWPAASCNPFQFFNSHSAVFDTTLCGDWAGGVWTDAGIPGQEQSCAQRTGFSTCEAFVLASGSSFQQAYWEVSYVKLFQHK